MEIIKEEELKSSLKDFLEDHNPDSVEGQKYDFHLSDWILKASFGRPVNISALTANEKTNAVVSPGETVFVLTHEYLKLPSDISVSLAPKRKIGHEGIMEKDYSEDRVWRSDIKGWYLK